MTINFNQNSDVLSGSTISAAEVPLIDATENSIIHVDCSVKTEPNDEEDYDNILEVEDEDDEMGDPHTIIKSENIGSDPASSCGGSNQAKKTFSLVSPSKLLISNPQASADKSVTSIQRLTVGTTRDITKPQIFKTSTGQIIVVAASSIGAVKKLEPARGELPAPKTKPNILLSSKSNSDSIQSKPMPTIVSLPSGIGPTAIKKSPPSLVGLLPRASGTVQLLNQATGLSRSAPNLNLKFLNQTGNFF